MNAASVHTDQRFAAEIQPGGETAARCAPVLLADYDLRVKEDIYESEKEDDCYGSCHCGAAYRPEILKMMNQSQKCICAIFAIGCILSFMISIYCVICSQKTPFEALQSSESAAHFDIYPEEYLAEVSIAAADQDILIFYRTSAGNIRCAMLRKGVLGYRVIGLIPGYDMEGWKNFKYSFSGFSDGDEWHWLAWSVCPGIQSKEIWMDEYRMNSLFLASQEMQIYWVTGTESVIDAQFKTVERE